MCIVAEIEDTMNDLQNQIDRLKLGLSKQEFITKTCLAEHNTLRHTLGLDTLQIQRYHSHSLKKGAKSVSSDLFFG